MKHLILLALLLTGCDMFDNPKGTPKSDEAVIIMTLVDDDALPANTYAQATYNEIICEVKIKRSVYPDCIKHEVRHCFEGNWHEGHESHDDCFHD